MNMNNLKSSQEFKNALAQQIAKRNEQSGVSHLADKDIRECLILSIEKQRKLGGAMKSDKTVWMPRDEDKKGNRQTITYCARTKESFVSSTLKAHKDKCRAKHYVIVQHADNPHL